MNGGALPGPGAGRGWAQTNFESEGGLTLPEVLDGPLPPAVTSDPAPSFPSPTEPSKAHTAGNPRSLGPAPPPGGGEAEAKRQNSARHPPTPAARFQVWVGTQASRSWVWCPFRAWGPCVR